ncbi:hypothetical protein GCM10018785_13800 [Streptomyces longispororuber]|uniref:Uncharacterized protein n=1 Tax=Streptomyces longispororuber TaxID=68230 RepID=A0A919DIC4_9ACTN|nr:hypothetical protein GCM10018785_13800 [Streptomyces longispororuber]
MGAAPADGAIRPYGRIAGTRGRARSPLPGGGGHARVVPITPPRRVRAPADGPVRPFPAVRPTADSVVRPYGRASGACGRSRSPRYGRVRPTADRPVRPYGRVRTCTRPLMMSFSAFSTAATMSLRAR